MATGTIKRPQGETTTVSNIINNTYGEASFAYNKTLGIGWVTWIGNGNNPSGATYTADITSYIGTLSQTWSTGTRRGGVVSVEDQGLSAQIKVITATTTWDAGCLCFPIG